MKKHAEMGIKVHKLTSVTSLAIPDLSTAIISAHYKADKHTQTISIEPTNSISLTKLPKPTHPVRRRRKFNCNKISILSG